MRSETQLHRQIHPNFIVNGEVGQLAFRPFESDKGLLSTVDGDRITAEAAWKRHTIEFRLQSKGSLAVTSTECAMQALPVVEDGGTNDLPAEHVSIDFTGLSRKEVKTKSLKLRDAALARGWTFRSG